MEKVIKNIFVPINFSNSSDKALQVAIAMCKRHGAALHLLKVNSETEFPYPSGKNALLIGIRLESRVAELEFMENSANQLAKKHGIKCFFHLEDGIFSKTVIEVAANFYCDLIVLEKKSGSSRFSLSFNRDIGTIIKNSPCPVMTVPQYCYHSQFKSVIFPVWVKKNILTKLHVALPIIEKNSSNVILFGSIKSPGDNEELNIMNKLMSSVRALISLTAKNIEDEVLDSPGTAKRILRKAVERKSDLIVIPTTTNAGFPSLFRSSYTRFIINNSTVPVLCEK